MIKTTYNHLGLLNTQQAVQKLANSTFKDPSAFSVKFITKAVRDGFFKMRDDYKKEIEEKYAVREEGKIMEPKAGSKAAELSLPFHCEDAQAGDIKGALEEFNKTEFKLDRKKITPEILFSVNEWTPRELEAIEFLVSEPGDPA